MNRSIPRLGAAVVAVSVFLFAVFMIIDFPFGSYLVCMFLPMGYILMSAGLRHECPPERRVAADVGLVFAAIYAALILLVYFAQTTSVRLEALSDQASRLLDYGNGGLLFNYDLLGYGMMALSTFFMGLSMEAQRPRDRWLKYLLMIHGVFFIGCFIMPMTGAFASMAEDGGSGAGTAALLFWCAYFLPVGILSFLHLGK